MVNKGTFPVVVVSNQWTGLLGLDYWTDHFTTKMHFQTGECKSWTLDWTMDWTMDWNMDSILDSFTSQGLDQEQCLGTGEPTAAAGRSPRQLSINTTINITTITTKVWEQTP